MANSPNPIVAGGFPIAAGVLGGCIIGFIAGEPTIGFFIGLVAGLIVAAILWSRGRV